MTSTKVRGACVTTNLNEKVQYSIDIDNISPKELVQN
jgi:hypothetical protein